VTTKTDNCCYTGEWGDWEGWKYIDKDEHGNKVNTEQGQYGEHGAPHYFKYYKYRTRTTKNCDGNTPTEDREYYCGRGKCRYRTRYHANAYGYPAGKHCEKYEKCSKDDNNFIKGKAYDPDYTTNTA
jgi:hypothetical protein